MSAFRSVRAALTIALAWAIPWMIGGIAINVFAGIHGNFRYFALADIVRELLIFAAAWAFIGAVNGFLFSLMLSTVGKRWRGGLNGLSVGMLGAIAGSILPIAIFAAILPPGFAEKYQAVVAVLAVVLVGAGLGGLLGIATFAAARHEALDR